MCCNTFLNKRTMVAIATLLSQYHFAEPMIFRIYFLQQLSCTTFFLTIYHSHSRRTCSHHIQIKQELDLLKVYQRVFGSCGRANKTYLLPCYKYENNRTFRRIGSIILCQIKKNAYAACIIVCSGKVSLSNLSEMVVMGNKNKSAVRVFCSFNSCLLYTSPSPRDRG